MRRLKTLQCHVSHRRCHALATLHPHNCSHLLSSPLLSFPFLSSLLLYTALLCNTRCTTNLFCSVPICSTLLCSKSHYAALLCCALHSFLPLCAIPTSLYTTPCCSRRLTRHFSAVFIHLRCSIASSSALHCTVYC